MILERLKQETVFPIGTDMFRQEIIFVYGDDLLTLEEKVLEAVKEEYHKKVRKIFKGLKKDNGVGGEKKKRSSGLYHAKQPIRIIYVSMQNTLSDFMQIMSHEALHATLEILDYVGIPLGDDSEEAYTYLLGHIVDNIVYKVFEYVEVEPELSEEEKIEKELLEDIGIDENTRPAPPTVADVEMFVDRYNKYYKLK
jgi:hypothetical protein